jgi:hypothetical protein
MESYDSEPGFEMPGPDQMPDTTDEPTVELGASEYDQQDAMGYFLRAAEDVVLDYFPDATEEEVDMRCHSVVSDFVANALTAVIYREDAELLDAIFRKATTQAMQLWQRDERETAMSLDNLEALLRDFVAGRA